MTKKAIAVKNGDYTAVFAALDDLDHNKDWSVTIKRLYAQRSIPSNRLAHFWYKLIGDHIGEHPEDVKEYLKLNYCPKNGSYSKLLGDRLRRTSLLDDKEHAEYLDKVKQWAWHNLEMHLPNAEDLMRAGIEVR